MDNSTDTPEVALASPSSIRMAAMNFLALREHSKVELSKKLSQRFGHHPALDDVLHQLVVDGLQSDSRFADAFSRMRFRQGKGPRRVSLELAERGIKDQLVHRALWQQNLDWFDLCLRTKDRRFGAGAPTDLKEKARQTRFLQYRGFDGDQIQYAFDTKSQ